jgi:hypothetical protein
MMIKYVVNCGLCMLTLWLYSWCFIWHHSLINLWMFYWLYVVQLCSFDDVSLCVFLFELCWISCLSLLFHTLCSLVVIFLPLWCFFCASCLWCRYLCRRISLSCLAASWPSSSFFFFGSSQLDYRVALIV